MHVGSPACLAAAKEGFAALGEQLATAAGRAALHTQFGLCGEAGEDALAQV
jgi:hypothetical protein